MNNAAVTNSSNTQNVCHQGNRLHQKLNKYAWKIMSVWMHVRDYVYSLGIINWHFCLHLMIQNLKYHALICVYSLSKCSKTHLCACAFSNNSGVTPRTPATVWGRQNGCRSCPDFSKWKGGNPSPYWLDVPWVGHPSNSWLLVWTSCH